MNTIFYSSPLFFIFFLLLGTLGYVLIHRHSAKGKDHPKKYLPYTGGQDFPTKDIQLSYQAFFRLGLLFAVLHVAGLVLSLLPFGREFSQIGVIYLTGIAISTYVLVLTRYRNR